YNVTRYVVHAERQDGLRRRHKRTWDYCVYSDTTSALGGNDGQDCKDCRPQEGYGHLQEHGLSQGRQAHPHRETGERPRARRGGKNVHFVLGMRVLRKVVSRWLMK